eukprot:8516084-Pyramimonas_sp.AAC.1
MVVRGRRSSWSLRACWPAPWGRRSSWGLMDAQMVCWWGLVGLRPTASRGPDFDGPAVKAWAAEWRRVGIRSCIVAQPVNVARYRVAISQGIRGRA